jgi:hypothetical protein
MSEIDPQLAALIHNSMDRDFERKATLTTPTSPPEWKVDEAVERMGEALAWLGGRLQQVDFIHSDSNPISDANAAAYESVGKAWDKLTAAIAKATPPPTWDHYAEEPVTSPPEWLVAAIRKPYTEAYATWVNQVPHPDKRYDVTGYIANHIATELARLCVGRDELADLIGAAYHAGATDVHRAWVDGNGQSEADFGEAASDYIAHVLHRQALSKEPS